MYTNTISESRPNRFGDKKDLDYHRRYARSIIEEVSKSSHDKFIFKSLVNRSFAKGNQWIFNEDLDPFLMDESGEVRNRIKFVQNIVRPVVSYYRGSAIRMDISAKPESISIESANRRELELSKVRFLSKMSREYPTFSDALKKEFNVVDDERESVEAFSQEYVDRHAKTVNHIKEYIATVDNDIEEIKIRSASFLATDGIGVIYRRIRNGKMIFDVIDPRYYFYDMSATRPDHRDCAYQGHFDLVSVPEIAERMSQKNELRLRVDELKDLDENKYGNFLGIHKYLSPDKKRTGKYPIYNLSWVDAEYKEFGCVVDEWGYESLEIINDGENPRFTDSDCITPSPDFYKHILDGKPKVKRWRDVRRYASILLKEYTGLKNDVVLEYGRVPYGDQRSVDNQFVESQYSVYCWSYDEGEVISPIDDLISIQRFANRSLSMFESRVNNTRMSGPIIDKDFVPAQGGEEEIQRNMNQGKPIFLETGGRINNAVGSYRSDLGAGDMMFLNVATTMQHIANQTVGGGQSLMGGEGSYRASATVSNQNLNQGTIMQEPFFYALNRLIVDTMAYAANVGKRLYIDNPGRLAVIVGDMGVVEINLTRELENEMFRMRTIRTQSPHKVRQAVDSMLLQLFQGQLIDRETLSQFYGKSSFEDVGSALRTASIKAMQAQKEAAKQQATSEDAASNLQMIQGEMQRNDEMRSEEIGMRSEEANRENALLKQLLQKG